MARHDRLVALFLRMIVTPASLASQGKYFKGKAAGLLFGTEARPANALDRAKTSLLAHTRTRPAGWVPTAIDFMVTGTFSSVSSSSRSAV